MVEFIKLRLGNKASKSFILEGGRTGEIENEIKFLFLVLLDDLPDLFRKFQVDISFKPLLAHSLVDCWGYKLLIEGQDKEQSWFSRL